MNGSSLSDDLEQAIIDYVLGDLTTEQTQELEQLLAANPDLRVELARLQEAMAMLPYSLPEVEPPSHLRHVVLTAGQRSQHHDRSSQRWSVSWSKVAAGVAAVVALVLGFDNYRLRQTVDRLQAEARQQAELTALLQQPNPRLVSLKGVESPATGSIILASGKETFVITVRQLPPLSADQIYRLWAVIDEQKILCAEFNTTPQEKVASSNTFPANACSSQRAKLVVTREPFPAPPQPVGNAVLIAQ